MARQVQDFNRETNRQFTTLVNIDSSRVTIDLVDQVENCSDVRITMKQIEVEKVVEPALVVLNQRRQRFRRQDADDPRTEGDPFPV